jgi:hypothetical protein
MTIILRKFNMKYINYNSLVLIIGLHKTGKSYLTKDLLYHHNEIPLGLVISNKFSNKNVYNYIPPIYIHEEYNNEFIKKYVKKQIKLVENSEYDTSNFIIFEDCLTFKDYKQNKYLRKLFKSLYELNTLCIIETIELEKIYKHLIMKDKIDYIFITKNIIQNNKKEIFDAIYSKIKIEFTVFCKFLDDYTDDYNCLVVYLKTESKYIEDKLFWYKANNHFNFKMCCVESWNYNNNHLIIEPSRNYL